MTRKDYNAIAGAIRNTKMDDATRDQLAYNMACAVREFNPRFDFQRFIEACKND